MNRAYNPRPPHTGGLTAAVAAVLVALLTTPPGGEAAAKPKRAPRLSPGR